MTESGELRGDGALDIGVGLTSQVADRDGNMLAEPLPLPPHDPARRQAEGPQKRTGEGGIGETIKGGETVCGWRRGALGLGPDPPPRPPLAVKFFESQSEGNLMRLVSMSTPMFDLG